MRGLLGASSGCFFAGFFRARPRHLGLCQLGLDVAWFEVVTVRAKAVDASGAGMRVGAVAVVLVFVGCVGAEDASRVGEACEEVYGPLFDPAGFREDVEVPIVRLRPASGEAGCRVLEGEDAIRARLADAEPAGARDVDAGRVRLVVLEPGTMPEGACGSFAVGSAYRLSTGSLVIETRTGQDAACEAPPSAWGVLVPRDGTRIVHAHDRR